PARGASMLRYAAIPVRVRAQATSVGRQTLSVNGLPPLMPTTTNPGCTTGIPSPPHCGQDTSTPHAAERWSATFAPVCGNGAGVFGGADGPAVGGCIATGSVPAAAAGFGGAAEDGTRGPRTTRPALATTSTAAMAAANSRAALI